MSHFNGTSKLSCTHQFFSRIHIRPHRQCVGHTIRSRAHLRTSWQLLKQCLLCIGIRCCGSICVTITSSLALRTRILRGNIRAGLLCYSLGTYRRTLRNSRRFVLFVGHRDCTVSVCCVHAADKADLANAGGHAVNTWCAHAGKAAIGIGVLPISSITRARELYFLNHRCRHLLALDVHKIDRSFNGLALHGRVGVRCCIGLGRRIGAALERHRTATRCLIAASLVAGFRFRVRRDGTRLTEQRATTDCGHKNGGKQPLLAGFVHFVVFFIDDFALL